MSVLCFKNHFILESQDLGDPTTVACNIILKSFFNNLRWWLFLAVTLGWLFCNHTNRVQLWSQKMKDWILFVMILLYFQFEVETQDSNWKVKKNERPKSIWFGLMSLGVKRRIMPLNVCAYERSLLRNALMWPAFSKNMGYSHYFLVFTTANNFFLPVKLFQAAKWVHA